MIAKILSNSATFNGILYNEAKVKEGVAELLEMNAMGAVGQMGANRTAEATRQYMIEFSRQNDRIKYPQFHVILSCKGQEYDKVRLLDFAHQYLEEMGYDYKNVPTMIYYHQDTDNNHLHIITSRVDKDGNKVNHNHEKRRSNKIVNNLMNVDFSKEAKEHISKALQYNFANVGQFKAIMESWGYETYEDKNSLKVKKGGEVLLEFPVDKITENAKNAKNAKRNNQVKALLHKFHNLSCNKEDLVKYMKDLFGISIVFVGKKDSPYGFFLVDHKQGMVYKGSEFMKIKDLLTFQSFEDRKQQVENSIQNALKANPRATTRTINSILRRYGASVAKGHVKIVNRKIRLDESLYSSIKHNDKINFIQQFNPASDIEREALAHVFKVQAEELATSDQKLKTQGLDETIDTLKHIIDHANEYESLYKDLDDNNIILLKFNDSRDYVAVDMQRKTVVSLADVGIQMKIGRSYKADEEKARTSKQSAGVGQGSVKIRGINLSGGSASNSINQNPDDAKKTNWEELEGHNGLKR